VPVAILERGLFVPAQWVDENPGVLAHFTFPLMKSEYLEGEMVTLKRDIPTYARQGEFYEFSRGDLSKVYQLFGEFFQIEDRRSVVPLGIDLSFDATLREEQKRVLRALLDPNIGGMLEAPPAFGKTVCMAALAVSLGMKLLVLVNKSDLRDQFINTVRKMTNINELEERDGCQYVGEIEFDSQHRPTTFPLTVSTYQMLIQDDKRIESIKDLFGVIFVDECHRAPADSLYQIIMRNNAALRFGVTATPKRKDGYHVLLPDLLGPIRAQSLGQTEHADVNILPGHFINISKNAAWPAVISALAKSQERNNKIATQTQALVQEGRRVMVLTDRKGHVAALAQLMEMRGLRVSTLTGDDSKETRDGVKLLLDALEQAIAYIQANTVQADEIEWADIITWEDLFEILDCFPDGTRKVVLGLYEHRKDVLVATTNLLSEGSDYPMIDTLVISMPIGNNDTKIKQMVGRVQRTALRKKSPLCIYYADAGHGILYGCAKSFERICHELGYGVSVLKSSSQKKTDIQELL
jgi:superfamily II DNA or RNA helicase